MAEFTLKFSESTTEFGSGVFDEVTIVSGEEWPLYDGVTEVIPRIRGDTVLETAHTRVAEDITVKKVPYYETGNVSGITVYIGGDE